MRFHRSCLILVSIFICIAYLSLPLVQSTHNNIHIAVDIDIDTHPQHPHTHPSRPPHSSPNDPHLAPNSTLNWSFILGQFATGVPIHYVIDNPVTGVTDTDSAIHINSALAASDHTRHTLKTPAVTARVQNLYDLYLQHYNRPINKASAEYKKGLQQFALNLQSVTDFNNKHHPTATPIATETDPDAQVGEFDSGITYSGGAPARATTALDDDGFTRLSPNGPQFDMSLDEFKKTHGGLRVPKDELERHFTVGSSNQYIMNNDLECKALFGTCMAKAECKTTLGLVSQPKKCKDASKVCCYPNKKSKVDQYYRYRSGESLNWLDKGVINPIRDQTPCNACYAFSSVAVMESAMAIKTGRLYSFSERQIVDCSSAYGDNQCVNGWYGDAFRYMLENENHKTHEAAVSLRSTYPFDPDVTSQSCDPQLSRGYQSSAFLSGFYYLTRYDIPEIMQWVDKGPVASAIFISCDEVRHYTVGIIQDLDKKCRGMVEHAIAITGYGTEDGVDYWWVRNSWGTTWGYQGYGKVERGKNLLQIESWVMAVSIDVPASQIPSYPIQ